MLSRKLVVLLGAGVVAGPLLAQQSPGLGVEISPEDLAPWNISIEADGTGLPPGSGNVSAGEAIYMVQCIGCHGIEGQGRPNDRLVGGHGTLSDLNPVRTIGSYWPYATTIFDYIRRAMPYTAPKSLNDDQVYALTAYLLYLNGIIAEDDVMDAQSLAQVRMPNRDGFILAYPRREAD